MKARKTIEVQSIKKFANEQLAHPNNSLEEKLGIMTMIEQILSKTGNYNGYMFLNFEGETPPNIGTYEWACRKYF